MIRFVALALLVAPGAAHAFCGTYVGGPGTRLKNGASQVVYARAGDQTTLTLLNDFDGDASEFALVIPVPEVLGPEDVTRANGDLVDLVQQYSTPRVVRYTCDDLVREGHSRPSLGCAEYAMTVSGDVRGATADDSVTVESAFTVGEYEIVVLSAEESGDLLGWLDTNGYALPDGGEPVLQEYIDGGAYFLAAKVTLEAVEEGPRWLSPLQIRYRSDVLSLPIRIGTISADGPQELVVYALTDAAQGALGIANYPEVTLDDECMWRPDHDGQSFGDYYTARLDEAFGDEASWLVEYSWDVNVSCDPCTADQSLTPQDLVAMGFPGDDYHASAWLTRLRVRYTPEQAVQDLVFYPTNRQDLSQIRYIEHLADLEFVLPVCGEGMVDDPGTCDQGEARGCAVPVGTSSSGVAVLIAALLRRRRR